MLGILDTETMKMSRTLKTMEENKDKDGSADVGTKNYFKFIAVS